MEYIYAKHIERGKAEQHSHDSERGKTRHKKIKQNIRGVPAKKIPRVHSVPL